MCGIFGYAGEEKATPILIEGLKRLEYRGYDSAGICIVENGSVVIEKKEGRLENLIKKIDEKRYSSTVGIGHTRWATHGKPSFFNSHPHTSKEKLFTVVHNGIIENYIELKDKLIKKGYNFISETDTEVIAQLLYDNFRGDALKTIITTSKQLNGAFSLGIIFKDTPDIIYALRNESPLIIGESEKGNFIASDIPAMLTHTNEVYYPDNGEIAVIGKKDIKFYNDELVVIEKIKEKIHWDVETSDKGGYEHYMLKEIFEQPEAFKKTVFPRIKDGKINIENLSFIKKEIRKIYIVGCGSAYHVGVTGKYIIEEMCRIPVLVDIASEFRYRNPLVDNDTLFIAISQSGETADTLAALREAKKRGAKTLSIVNSVGSSIARESENIIYTFAGPEIAVATTKAYSAQLSAIYLLALYIGDNSKTEELKEIPSLIEKILLDIDIFKEYGNKFKNTDKVFFIGRGLDYSVCLEGSLKLKEISYIHSEAYPAGELKHGTISLIEEGTLVVALATQLTHKTISNIKEVRARGATVFVIANENENISEDIADYVYYIPKTNPFFSPSLSIIPLQLIAYYIAKKRNCDIDKPKNLAKSVTVE